MMMMMKIVKIISLFIVFLNANGYCSPLIDLFNNHKNEILFNNPNLNNNNNNNNFNLFNPNKIDFDNYNFQSLNDESSNLDLNNKNDSKSYQEDFDSDNSIFGNTDESFYEFGNRRMQELQNKNKQLFDKAISSCQYAPTNLDTENQPTNIENNNEFKSRFLRSETNNEECDVVVGSFNFENVYGRTSDRLFLLDPFHIGLISSFDSTMRLYSFNMFHRTLTHIRTKYFKNEVPHDACADKSKNIYVVFPDQNKIAKYILNHTNIPIRSNNPNKQNKTQTILREVISIRDIEFRPSSIACHDDLIYVSERPKNVIRIYDKILRLVRIIYLNGIIVSTHHALAVNQNVRVLLDGLDGLALFNPPQLSNLNSNINNHRNNINNNNNNIPSSTPTIFSVKNAHRKKNSLMLENNKVNVCHFYKNMNCLEDVHVAAEPNSKSFIYVADSCNNDIKQFLYTKDEKIQLTNRFIIKNGNPISVITNQLGYIFVLTDRPRKILILDPKECKIY